MLLLALAEVVSPSNPTVPVTDNVLQGDEVPTPSWAPVFMFKDIPVEVAKKFVGDDVPKSITPS